MRVGRRSGEGETPQEFLVIEFQLAVETIRAAIAPAELPSDIHGDIIRIPVATLRPETIDGVTNLWVNPTIEYVLVHLNKQANIIISKDCAQKLSRH